MEEKFLTIPELAKRMGISRIAVFKKVKKGQIKAIRIGKYWAIPVESVENLKDRPLPPLNISESVVQKKKVINIKETFVDKNVENSEKISADKTMSDMGWD